MLGAMRAETECTTIRLRPLDTAAVGELLAAEAKARRVSKSAIIRELLEKTIAKILHRHCNFGWANYYIPSEKFPSLIEELVEVMSPGGQAGHDELVQFFLGVQRLSSIQERVAKLEQEFSVYKRG